MGSSLWRPWYERHFVLSDDDGKISLSYFDKSTLKGTLTLKGAKVYSLQKYEEVGDNKGEDTKDQTFVFKIKLSDEKKKELGKKNSLIAKASDKTEMDEWINRLKIAIDLSDAIEGKTESMDTLKKTSASESIIVKEAIKSILLAGEKLPYLAPICSTFNMFFTLVEKISTNDRRLRRYCTEVERCGDIIGQLSKKEDEYRKKMSESTKFIEAVDKVVVEVRKGEKFTRELYEQQKEQDRKSGFGKMVSCSINALLVDVHFKELDDMKEDLKDAMENFFHWKGDFESDLQRMISRNYEHKSMKSVDFSEFNVISECFELLDRTSFDQAITTSCLSRVFLLSGGEAWSHGLGQDYVVQIEQVDDFACNTIKKIFNKFSNEPDILISLMKLIFNLAKSPKTKDRFLSALGTDEVCKLMCNALKVNISNRLLISHGMTAVYEMATDNDRIIEAFYKNGIRDLIENVITRF